RPRPNSTSISFQLLLIRVVQPSIPHAQPGKTAASNCSRPNGGNTATSPTGMASAQASERQELAPRMAIASRATAKHNEADDDVRAPEKFAVLCAGPPVSAGRLAGWLRSPRPQDRNSGERRFPGARSRRFRRAPDEGAENGAQREALWRPRADWR